MRSQQRREPCETTDGWQTKSRQEIAGAFMAFVDTYGPRLHRLVRRYTALRG